MGSPLPRANFETTGDALITVLTVFSGEDWDEAMAEAMVATPTAAVPYFCVVYAIGNFLLVSLCVAVVVAGWEATKEMPSPLQADGTLKVRTKSVSSHEYPNVRRI
jgi:large-conductance mechanosensitive channel